MPLKRVVVGTQMKHRGGLALLEKDPAGHFLVNCMGCGIDKLLPTKNKAKAIYLFINHTAT